MRTTKRKTDDLQIPVHVGMFKKDGDGDINNIRPLHLDRTTKGNEDRLKV